MNTSLNNEAKSTLESNITTVVSLTEMLEANNAELDKLNEMIEEYFTDEKFAAEFEAVVRYQDAARGPLGELKAREALLILDQYLSVTVQPAATPIVQKLDETRA